MLVKSGKSSVANIMVELQKLSAAHTEENIRKALEMSNLVTPVEPKPLKEISFQEAEHWYLNSAEFERKSESTKITYRSEWRQFSRYIHTLPKIPNLLAFEDEPLILVEYLNSASSQNTRSKKASFLRDFFTRTFTRFYELDIKRIKENLVIKIPFNNELPKAFTRVQIEEIVNLSRLTNDGFRNYTMLWVFLGSGVRLNALTQLQIGDVFYKEKYIMVREKGDKLEKVPRFLTPSSLNTLRMYIAFKYGHLRNIDGYCNLYVFSATKGQKPLSDNTVQAMFDSLIEDAQTLTTEEKQRLTIHSLRHSFALFALQEGIDIVTIQKLLGHKSLKTTMIYLELFNSMLLEAIEKHPFSNSAAADLFQGVDKE